MNGPRLRFRINCASLESMKKPLFFKLDNFFFTQNQNHFAHWTFKHLVLRCPIYSNSLSSFQAKQAYSKVHQNQFVCWWKIFSKCFLESVLHKEPKIFWIFKICYYLGVRFAPIRLVHLNQNRLIPKYIRINLFVDENFF